MTVVYATLITEGKKKFSDVPEAIREQVKEVLTNMGAEELVK